eukprot:15457826-Alexandrium_andersonii.AAC.1
MAPPVRPLAPEAPVRGVREGPGGGGAPPVRPRAAPFMAKAVVGRAASSNPQRTRHAPRAGSLRAL